MSRSLIFALAVLMAATTASGVSIPSPPSQAPAQHRVEVVGDLGTADRIAVIVPGVGVTVDNFDHGLGGVRRRSPRWQARRLYAAASRRAAANEVAVVAWLGYRPPDGIGWEAVRSDAAVAGAAALRRFVESLPRRASVTLIGHSYGSLVLAYAAAALPESVTDLVVLGSPGLDVPHVSGLGTSARVWAAQADGDWIRWVPHLRIFGLGHGADPAASQFGARRLDVTGAYGHDRYFQAGSLRSLAAIVSGNPDGDHHLADAHS